eukprot:15452120-Alexandrium_andersonii.AAC.1
MEVFSPPRGTAVAGRGPGIGSSRKAPLTCSPVQEASRGTLISLATARGRSDSSPLASRSF